VWIRRGARGVDGSITFCSDDLLTSTLQCSNARDGGAIVGKFGSDDFGTLDSTAGDPGAGKFRAPGILSTGHKNILLTLATITYLNIWMYLDIF
jgi:hypothetical protein